MTSCTSRSRPPRSRPPLAVRSRSSFRNARRGRSGQRHTLCTRSGPSGVIMPLIHYRQFLTYPDGNPAANTLFPLMLSGGNVLVPTFVDKAGTIPLPNPVLTGVDGLIDFYAAPGAYAVD